jgi:hypothetical protein
MRTVFGFGASPITAAAGRATSALHHGMARNLLSSRRGVVGCQAVTACFPHRPSFGACPPISVSPALLPIAGWRQIVQHTTEAFPHRVVNRGTRFASVFSHSRIGANVREQDPAITSGFWVVQDLRKAGSGRPDGARPLCQPGPSVAAFCGLLLFRGHETLTGDEGGARRQGAPVVARVRGPPLAEVTQRTGGAEQVADGRPPRRRNLRSGRGGRGPARCPLLPFEGVTATALRRSLGRTVQLSGGL